MTGPRCTERVYHVRRNIFTFGALEKSRFMMLMKRMRHVDSGYDILIEDRLQSSDPLSSRPKFRSASLHYYIVYIHRYASRPTLFDDPHQCRDNDFMDFNHGGPGFPTWHRMFMLLWERGLRHMAEDMFGWKDFAIPYWDWIDAKRCEICTNDLMGAAGLMDSDGNQRLHWRSPFYHWDEYCSFRGRTSSDACRAGCHFWKFKKLNRHFKHFDFPTTKEVEFALTRKVYYVPPRPGHLTSSKCAAFSEALEGHCGYTSLLPRRLRSSKTSFVHNAVHNMVKGSFCCSSTAPNDPKFILHHSQVTFQIFYGCIFCSAVHA